MAGRFEGLSDAEWKLLEGIFPGKEGRSRGMPVAHSHKALNLPLFIFTTGYRWCDLPRWVSKSSRRRRLKAWHLDGALNELKAMILGISGTRRMIRWNSEDADGSFSNWERRRQRG
ncbi:MAG: transposase [Candidatus Electronema sp. V4]|uniref:transposase n=1 Tax=Candidatus Electronema sp. V4 TaxID=3454756 RepID=UPI0040558028